MIRVVIAVRSPDDRARLSACLESDPEVTVLAVTAHGIAATAAVRQHRPDIVLVDARLAGPGTEEVTRAIMSEVPTPIIILLAPTQDEGASEARAALEAGALAIAEMPSDEFVHGVAAGEAKIVTMTKAMAGVKVVRRRPQRTTPVEPMRHVAGGMARPVRARIVVIASSTGGPAALRAVLATVPPELPAPILVVQHISQDFVGSLARWLSGLVRLRVRVAAHGERLQRGTVYFAPDGMHLGVDATGAIQLSDAEAIGGFRPSATHLFESAARAFGPTVLAVVLTGMGVDGVEGLRAVHASGGHILTQDEGSSVVFGMPGEAARSGLVHEVLPVHQLGPRLVQLVLGDTNAA